MNNQQTNQEQMEDSSQSNKDYVFVGNCKTRTTTWGAEETNIGFSHDHLKLLIENLNEKGWVNIAMRQGKAGKYMHIINPISSLDSHDD